MCTFISVTLNADADPAAVQSVFDRLGFRFEDVPPTPEMPAGRRHLAHRTGHCDCGTAIGSGFHAEKPAYDPMTVASLRRKGWSASKIERWKAQKLQADDKSRRAELDVLESVNEELRSWKALLLALLATLTVRVVGIMHDNYASGPSHPDYPTTVEPPRAVALLDEDRLFRLPGGTLAQWTL